MPKKTLFPSSQIFEIFPEDKRPLEEILKDFDRASLGYEHETKELSPKSMFKATELNLRSPSPSVEKFVKRIETGLNKRLFIPKPFSRLLAAALGFVIFVPTAFAQRLGNSDLKLVEAASNNNSNAFFAALSALENDENKIALELEATLDERKMTPLLSAIQVGNVPMVKALLKKGANVNNKDRWGNDAFTWAYTHHHTEIVELIIKNKNFNPNQIYHKFEGPILPYAIQTRNFNVVRALLEEGADVNLLDLSGNSALHNMVILLRIQVSQTRLREINKDHIEIIKLLLKHKDIDSNSYNREGETALTIAIKSNYPSLVNLLLQEGVNPNYPNKDGAVPIKLARSLGNNAIIKFVEDFSIARIIEAAKVGNIEEIKFYLSKNPELANTVDSGGWSALFSAVFNGHYEIVKILLEAGADINAIEKQNKFTPLFVAIIQKNVGIVKLLLENGAKIDTLVKGGVNTFEAALKVGNEEISELLHNKYLETVTSTKILEEKSKEQKKVESDETIKPKEQNPKSPQSDFVTQKIILTAAGGILIIGVGAYLAQKFITKKADKKEEFDVLTEVEKLVKSNFNNNLVLKKQGENIELLFGNNNSDKVDLFRGQEKIAGFSKKRFVEIFVKQKLIPFLETQKDKFGKPEFNKDAFIRDLKEVFVKAKRSIIHEHYFNELKDSLRIAQGGQFKIELQPAGQNQNLPKASLLKTDNSAIGAEETVVFNTQEIPVFDTLRNSLKTAATNLTIKASELKNIIESEREFNQDSAKNIAKKILENSNEYKAELEAKREETQRLERERVEKARLAEEKKTQEAKEQETLKKQEAERKAAQKAADKEAQQQRINQEKEQREEAARVKREAEEERKRVVDLEKESRRKQIENVGSLCDVIKGKIFEKYGLKPEQFVSFGQDPTKFALLPSSSLTGAKKDLEFSTEKFQDLAKKLFVEGSKITLKPAEVQKVVENLAKTIKEKEDLSLEQNLDEQGSLKKTELSNNESWEGIETAFLADLIKSSQEYRKHQQEEGEKALKERIKETNATNAFLSKAQKKLHDLTNVLDKLVPLLEDHLKQQKEKEEFFKGKDKLVEAMLFAAADFAEFLHNNKNSKEADNSKLNTILDFDEFYRVLRLPIVKDFDVKDNHQYLIELIVKKDLFKGLDQTIQDLQDPIKAKRKVSLVNKNTEFSKYDQQFNEESKSKEKEVISKVFDSEENYLKALKEVTGNINFYSEDLKKSDISDKDKFLSEKALRFNVARFGDLVKSEEHVAKEFQSKNFEIFKSLLSKEFLKGARNELWHGKLADAAIDVVQKMANDTNEIFKLLHEDQLEKAGLQKPKTKVQGATSTNSHEKSQAGISQGS